MPSTVSIVTLGRHHVASCYLPSHTVTDMEEFLCLSDLHSVFNCPPNSEEHRQQGVLVLGHHLGLTSSSFSSENCLFGVWNSTKVQNSECPPAQQKPAMHVSASTEGHQSSLPSAELPEGSAPRSETGWRWDGRSTAHHLNPLPALWLCHEFPQGKKKQLRTDTTKPNKPTWCHCLLGVL